MPTFLSSFKILHFYMKKKVFSSWNLRSSFHGLLEFEVVLQFRVHALSVFVSSFFLMSVFYFVLKNVSFCQFFCEECKFVSFFHFKIGNNSFTQLNIIFIRGGSLSWCIHKPRRLSKGDKMHIPCNSWRVKFFKIYGDSLAWSIDRIIFVILKTSVFFKPDIKLVFGHLL